MTSTKLATDPYTISDDGHIIGHDGFVVPKDFAEFYDRFPSHVRRFVRWKRTPVEDREDCEQQLLMHLMTLPGDSKLRQAGCRDRIEAFRPDAYGASEKRFFGYVNHCLRNHYSQWRRVFSNPVRSAVEPFDEGYVYSQVSKWFSASRIPYPDQSVMVAEFLAFVEEHNPELISVLNTIGQAETFIDAQRMLGMTEKLFLRARNRLVVLYEHFELGEVPPRQRKVYLIGVRCKRAQHCWNQGRMLTRKAEAAHNTEKRVRLLNQAIAYLLEASALYRAMP
jgi:hypothetical protein